MDIALLLIYLDKCYPLSTSPMNRRNWTRLWLLKYGIELEHQTRPPRGSSEFDFDPKMTVNVKLLNISKIATTLVVKDSFDLYLDKGTLMTKPISMILSFIIMTLTIKIVIS